MGIKDPKKKYQIVDMVQGDCLFAATGVTSGAMLSGVKFGKDVIETETVVMRSVTGTVRRVLAEHRQFDKFHLGLTAGSRPRTACPAAGRKRLKEIIMRHVHLVGSVPLRDAREVFTTVSGALGPRLKRIPDGETGARSDWITWLEPAFANNTSLEKSNELFRSTPPARRAFATSCVRVRTYVTCASTIFSMAILPQFLMPSSPSSNRKALCRRNAASKSIWCRRTR